MSDKQGILFDPRFLEVYAGSRLLSDPHTAIAELVANSWDAGATEVEIFWPRSSGGRFEIRDNGHGMTPDQLEHRWLTLAYDRHKTQGPHAEYPPGTDLPMRSVFGRNGIGRFAAFCFADKYFVVTMRDGTEVTYSVDRGLKQPVRLANVSQRKTDGTGTTIYVESVIDRQLTAADVRAEVGLRFLFDPNFKVLVNGKPVAFRDIPKHHAHKKRIHVDGVGNIDVAVIDTLASDTTTRQHGIAWQVRGRLVGSVNWRGFNDQSFIDGRRSLAKRLAFIVRADMLADAVLQDWNAFDPDSRAFQSVNDAVNAFIREHLLSMGARERQANYSRAREANAHRLRRMSPLAIEKWSLFVRQAQEECPSITERDLTQLAGVLAQLELSRSRYCLIEQLHGMKSEGLDDLNRLLDEWTLDMAKVVLDELKTRLTLLQRMERAVNDPQTQEVQELQPIFQRGLWIFGPEFETIEYTSNQGMTRVIQDLFGSSGDGSRNRPDFAILPDSTVGLYSYPDYDDEGAELGPCKLVVVELKKPTIRVSTDEKDQCWKYIRELVRMGHLLDHANATCFVLGKALDPVEANKRTELNGRVNIIPLTYNTVLERAKSRVLKLYDRVRAAPFLDGDEITKFIEGGDALAGQQLLDADAN
jgi:Histidine kinase-, DNA gyrase B-, and HSP90-like ATPase